jgi:hypothetical protein
MSGQTVILMFKDVSSYRKHKEEVVSSGGTIKYDLGETLLGFTAVIPPTSALLQLVCSGNSNSLDDRGISSFELDSKVTTQ